MSFWKNLFGHKPAEVGVLTLQNYKKALRPFGNRKRSESKYLEYLCFRDKAWRYIDTLGKFIMKPQFEEASDFSQGVAFVKIQGKYAMVNSEFVTVQPTVQPVMNP